MLPILSLSHSQMDKNTHWTTQRDILPLMLPLPLDYLEGQMGGAGGGGGITAPPVELLRGQAG